MRTLTTMVLAIAVFGCDKKKPPPFDLPADRPKEVDFGPISFGGEAQRQALPSAELLTAISNSRGRSGLFASKEFDKLTGIRGASGLALPSAQLHSTDDVREFFRVVDASGLPDFPNPWWVAHDRGMGGGRPLSDVPPTTGRVVPDGERFLVERTLVCGGSYWIRIGPGTFEPVSPPSPE